MSEAKAAPPAAGPAVPWPRRHAALLLVIATYLAVTVPLAFALPIWTDEAYTLRTSSLGVVEALRAAVEFERQGPLYFGVLTLWRLLAAGPVAARLLSVAFGAATLVICARISRRVAPDLSEAVLPAIICLHPLFLLAALEIRVYALAVLLSAVLAWLHLRIFLEEGKGIRDEVLFGVTAALAVYTQYYLGFLLVALFAGLLVAGRPGAAARYLRAMLVAAVLLAPLVPVLSGQLRSSDGSVAAPFLVRTFARFLLERWDALMLPAMSPFLEAIPVPALRRPLYWILRLVPWVAALALLARALRRGEWRRSPVPPWWTTVILFVGALGGVGLAVSAHLVAADRYATVLVVPAAMAVFSLLAPGGRRAAAVVVALLLASNGALAWDHYRVPVKYGDARRVAAYLQAHEAAGQPIFVFTSNEAMVLETYYRGVNRVVPLPGPVPLDRYDLRDLILPSEEEVERLVGAAASGADRVWLVLEDQPVANGLDLHPEHLVRCFDRRFLPVTSARFHEGLTVTSYRPRTAPAEAP